MENRIDIVHFHNGKGGGVWSVIKNLISFSTNPVFNQHIIIYHLKDDNPICDQRELPKHVHFKYLEYSGSDNYYHTCKNLAALIPNPHAILIAHDWMELGMCSHLGLSNPLLYYMHGDYDYYYSLFDKHREVIDETITVSRSMRIKLTEKHPLFTEHISYIRFPVPNAINKKIKRRKSIVFVGRLEEGKGFDIVLKIAENLSTDQEIEWHIVGDGASDWLSKIPTDLNIKIHGSLSNNKVLELLSEMEILVLPSTHEGMPIAVIEAMKAGVVPLVSDIPGGIQELIVEGKTGFKLKRENVSDWCERIKVLQSNNDQMQLLSASAKNMASEMFDPFNNVCLFEEKLKKLAGKTPLRKKKKLVYGSRLDKPWIPNSIVKMIRK